MGRLIVITGLDGTGTSSVGDELARVLRATLIHTPPEPFRGCRDLVDGEPRDRSPAAHYLFYLAAMVYADEVLIRPALERGDVVCVRHLLDTVISHRAAGINVALEYETSLYTLRKPDVVFCLVAEEPERRRRLEGRGKSRLDRTLEDDEFRQRMLHEFAGIGHLMRTVDTTHQPPAALALALARVL